MFSSRSFIVSGLTLRSLIHLEFIFVYGVRKCSSFILLQVVDQISQHHLLKRLSLIHCIFLPPLSKIRCPWCVGLSLGFCLYFAPFNYISVLVPISYCLDYCSFVAREPNSSSSIFLKIALVIRDSFVFPYKLLNYLFYFCEN